MKREISEKSKCNLNLVEFKLSNTCYWLKQIRLTHEQLHVCGKGKCLYNPKNVLEKCVQKKVNTI